MVTAFFVGLVGMLGQLDSKLFGEARLSQPIVIGALAGLACGDLRAGILLGAQFQLIWMGMMGVGATMSMDAASGTAMGTAFAVLNGADIGVGLIFALPMALLMPRANNWVRAKIIPSLMHKGDLCAEEGNTAAIGRLHGTGILIFALLLGFLPCFLCVLLGAAPSGVLIGALPPVVLRGLAGVAKVFPAFGFALLLNVTMDTALVPFFIIGFVLAACLEMSTLSIALLAVALAMVMFQLKRSSAPVQQEEEDDL